MFNSCLNQDVVCFLNDFHEAMSFYRQKEKILYCSHIHLFSAFDPSSSVKEARTRSRASLVAGQEH